jgi:hypothetical protein
MLTNVILQTFQTVHHAQNGRFRPFNVPDRSITSNALERQTLLTVNVPKKGTNGQKRSWNGLER